MKSDLREQYLKIVDDHKQVRLRLGLALALLISFMAMSQEGKAAPLVATTPTGPHQTQSGGKDPSGRDGTSSDTNKTHITTTTIIVGSSPASVDVSAIDTGWYDNSGFHIPTNSNYLVGNITDDGFFWYMNNFFVFDISAISGTITGATLEAYNPELSDGFGDGYFSNAPTEIWSLYDVSTPINTLTDGTGGVATYNDLGGGEFFGGVNVSNADNGSFVNVSLNAQAISSLNAAIGGQFAIGGTLSTLDGNSSTDEYLFGFTGLGPIPRLILEIDALSTGIFADGFESGDFSAWVGLNTGNGDLNVCAAAAMEGSFGACVDVVSKKRKQVWDQSMTDASQYRARFYFDPNGLSMGNNEKIRLMQLRTGVDTIRPAFVQVRYKAGGYEVRVRAQTDAGATLNGNWYPIADAPVAIEIDWMAATGDGNDDGYVTLWLGGVDMGTISGIDNDTLLVNEVKLGFTSRLGAKIISGTFYLDAFISDSAAYIAP